MVRSKKDITKQNEAILVRYLTRALSDPMKSDLIQEGNRSYALAERHGEGRQNRWRSPPNISSDVEKNVEKRNNHLKQNVLSG